MCNLVGKVFIDSKKGRSGKSNDDVVITDAIIHGTPGIRISLSPDALRKLGQGVDRIVFAVHPDYRNRLYIYDAKQINGCVGYKLSQSGTRKSVRVDTRSIKFDLPKAIGSHSLERDKYNDAYIALSTTI